jgi:hypothetical protein
MVPRSPRPLSIARGTVAVLASAPFLAALCLLSMRIIEGLGGVLWEGLREGYSLLLAAALTGLLVIAIVALTPRRRLALFWCRSNEGVASILAASMHLLNRVVRASPRIGPLWLALGIVGLVPVYAIVDMERTRPVTLEALGQVSTFINEETLEEPTGRRAQLPIDTAEAVRTQILRQYPAAAPALEALRIIYPRHPLGAGADTDGAPFDQRVSQAARRLEEVPGEPRDLGSLLSLCLRARLLLRMSHAGAEIPLVLQARDVLLQYVAVENQVAPDGEPRRITTPMRESYLNSWAASLRYFAARHEVYELEMGKLGMKAEDQISLIKSARETLLSTKALVGRSVFSELRLANNLADVAMVLLNLSIPRDHPGRPSDPRVPGTSSVQVSSEWPRGESILTDARKDLIEALTAGSRPSMYVTVAQLSSVLAHSAAHRLSRITDASERARGSYKSDMEKLRADLSVTRAYLEMAVRLGVKGSELGDPHELGVCWLVETCKYDNLFSSDILGMIGTERDRIQEFLHVAEIKVHCPVCADK